MEELDPTLQGLFAIKIGGGDADSDTTRSNDGSLIVNKVGRLLFKNGTLSTLEPVFVPTFNGIIERLKINYEIDHDVKEPDLTLEQTQATQRVVNYGGLLHTLSKDHDVSSMTLTNVYIRQNGDVHFAIDEHNDGTTKKYEAISKCSSMKIDDFYEADEYTGATESFITAAVIIGIVLYLFKMFFGKDKLSKEVDAKVKEMLKPLAKSIAASYEDYFSVARKIKSVIDDLNANGCQAKKYPAFEVLSFKEYMQQVHSFLVSGHKHGEMNLQGYLNGNMYMLPRPQRFIQLTTRNANGTVAKIVHKYSTKLTILTPSDAGDRIDIQISSGVLKPEFDKIAGALDKIHEANNVNGPVEAEKINDEQFGELTYMDQQNSWMMTEPISISNINGSTAHCRVWFRDEKKSGVTEQQKRVIIYLARTPGFVRSKFDMKKFESFIDDFDIQTPAAVIAKKMRFESMTIHQNGAFFITVRGDEEIDDLNIEVYFDKSLSTIGFEYGEGGFGHYDIGDE